MHIGMVGVLGRGLVVCFEANTRGKRHDNNKGGISGYTKSSSSHCGVRRTLKRKRERNIIAITAARSGVCGYGWIWAALYPPFHHLFLFLYHEQEPAFRQGSWDVIFARDGGSVSMEWMCFIGHIFCEMRSLGWVR
jgi:hypothetical protein